MKKLVFLVPMIWMLGCSDDGPATETDAATETGDGDGDGDPSTTGDGDGDPATGDGDGDPSTTGDGDGDPSTTGDGDGDPTTTGDGDGDAGVCGDGVVDEGEECDLGPDNDDMGECKSDCSAQVCGDGFMGPEEACDDGDQNGDDAACTSACVVAVCGDGLTHVGVEDCDAAGESAECNDDCTAALCGDGKLNITAGEACDGELGDLTCADEGFLGGDLSCSDVCELDTMACFDDFEATFTNCGQTGNLGPNQGQCDGAYANTSLEGAVTLNAGIQEWTVPFTATYAIEVWGAQGGNHNAGDGGNGARMYGEFDLEAGAIIQILVGQKGSDGTAYDVGGGGGTYVVAEDDTPLIIAGGGGGSGNCGGYSLAVMHGKSSIGDGNGGDGGNLGGWCGCGADGSPGGGFESDGMPSGGASFLNGGAGDDTERPGQCVDSGLGGFGGGGNGGNGGGGGGGYSGGDGGGSLAPVAGGGGESFNTGLNPSGDDGIKTGHGEVQITLLP